MTITELIAKLEEIRAEHGDLQVGMQDGEFGYFSPIDVAFGTSVNKDDAPELGSDFVQIFTEGGPW